MSYWVGVTLTAWATCIICSDLAFGEKTEIRNVEDGRKKCTMNIYEEKKQMPDEFVVYLSHPMSFFGSNVLVIESLTQNWCTISLGCHYLIQYFWITTDNQIAYCSSLHYPATTEFGKLLHFFIFMACLGRVLWPKFKYLWRNYIPHKWVVQYIYFLNCW